MSQSSGAVADVAIPLREADDVMHLVAEVQRTCPRPLNTLQVTALLETAGITDAIAAGRYGFADVFELGEVVTAEIAATLALSDPTAPGRASDPAVAEGASDEGASDEGASDEGASSEGASDRTQALARDYLRGPMNLLPLIVMVAMVSLYRTAAAWRDTYVIALSAASVASLLLTSGFVQVVARKGSIYLSQGYLQAAKRFLLIVMGLGLGTASIAAALGALVAQRVVAFDAASTSLLVSAAVVLSAFWLLAGLLSVVGQLHWFGVSLVTGAIVSGGLLWVLRGAGAEAWVSTTLPAAVGAAIAVAGMAVAFLRYFGGRVSAGKSAQRIKLPPPSHLIVALAPYFAHGVLYTLVVLAGHAGVVVGGLRLAQGQITAIAGAELALMLALVSYILTGGLAEHTMQRFWLRIAAYQDSVLAEAPQAFGRKVKAFYRRERRHYVVALVIGSVVVSLMVLLGTTLNSGRLLGVVWDRTIATVFAIGLVGYGFLGVAMFDAMLFITLSRPRFALSALAIALAVTLVSGMVLAITVSYAAGAWGVALGAGAAAVAMRFQQRRFLADADYHFYASF